MRRASEKEGAEALLSSRRPASGIAGLPPGIRPGPRRRKGRVLPTAPPGAPQTGDCGKRRAGWSAGEKGAQGTRGAQSRLPLRAAGQTRVRRGRVGPPEPYRVWFPPSSLT